MKSTGVIRRIDELGRIVIPKEIRRNLGIHDGENVEIYTDSDNIILKKYYRLNNSNNLAKSLCELINNEFNYKIIITDREKIISTSGIDKELINKKINKELLNILENREIVELENSELIIEKESLKGNFVIIPIISLNDCIGLIIMYNDNKITNELAIGKLVSSIFAYNKIDVMINAS